MFISVSRESQSKHFKTDLISQVGLDSKITSTYSLNVINNPFLQTRIYRRKKKGYEVSLHVTFGIVNTCWETLY